MGLRPDFPTSKNSVSSSNLSGLTDLGTLLRAGRRIAAGAGASGARIIIVEDERSAENVVMVIFARATTSKQ